MGSCFAKTVHEADPRQEQVIADLRQENASLRQEVDALKMQLHQQRAEVARLTFINEEDRRLLSSYKTRYWTLRMGDLLASRRLQPARPRGS